jgi:hypothetical protein
MRYLLTLCFIATSAFADSYEVYEYNEYGNREMFPSHSVEVEKDTVKIYEHNKYGRRDWAPSVEIQKQPSVKAKNYLDLSKVFEEPILLPQPSSNQYEHLLDY